MYVCMYVSPRKEMLSTEAIMGLYIEILSQKKIKLKKKIRAPKAKKKGHKKPKQQKQKWQGM